MQDDNELARIEASPGRRAFGLSVLVALGLIVLWLAVTQQGGSPAWRFVMLVLGGIVLWSARAMYRATARSLVLTREALTDSAGVVLAGIDEVESVDRGTFAFKPSNGFLLRLKARRPRLWQPGLYWRIGRRIGVGGVAHAAQSKVMADALAIMLAERAAAAANDTGDAD